MTVPDHGRARGAVLAAASFLSFLAGFLACAEVPGRVFDAVVSPSHAAAQPVDANEAAFLSRSEERRVGKECQ